MHTCDDSTIVEIVDDDGFPVGPGRTGNVVVTPLWRYSTPLIRYAIGDRAMIGSKCPCGRGLKVIKELQGRQNDLFSLPSGRRVFSAYLGAPLRAMPRILQFQIVQETRERLCVKAVIDGNRKEAEKGIRKAIRSALPERMKVEVEFVDRIQRRGEKLCDFISKLRPE
jgi:phenylacetate-CoA ligase